MSIADLYGGMDMTKVMLGKHAYHIGLNLIAQGYQPDTKVAGVFQTAHGLPLLHGSQRTHVLILGDAFIRPRIVVATDALQGYGVGALFKSGFLDIQELLNTDQVDVLLKPE